ncbi:MAG TPA: arginase family protein [Bacteroidales bacterium]|nr:arginase family protein [Bacteroidales bacterium]
MSDLNDYFDPVSIDSPAIEFLNSQAGFAHNISIHTESSSIKDLENFRIALIGIPEGRNSVNPGSSKAPDAVRSELYRLARIPGKLKIADLGNMKQGTTFNDTLAGLSDILVTLFELNTLPVIIGGSSALIPALDMAFSRTNTRYSLTAIDSRICYNHEKQHKNTLNYLGSIIDKSDSTFTFYSNIGYQTFLNDQQVLNRFLRKGSDLIRVGDVRNSISLMEPLMRDSEAIVLNIAAVRQSDAPGTACPSPNGFYGEEICLLSRFAGISDRVKVFGLFDVNPEFDVRSQTTALAAQIIWFFLEGFSQKQYETPLLGSGDPGRFIKYHVKVTGMDDDLIFVKSNLTERWWMELNAGDSSEAFVACSHDDYLKANRNEVPERWFKAVERLKH